MSVFYNFVMDFVVGLYSKASYNVLHVLGVNIIWIFADFLFVLSQADLCRIIKRNLGIVLPLSRVMRHTHLKPLMSGIQ